MKWTVLADNRAKDPSFKTEHGLSILLETERSRILLDTGASDVFIRNAMQMGIDLGTVDYVFVSHGHSDHAGGLRHFMEVNKRAKVIVAPEAVKGKFYSQRNGLHSITTVWPEEIGERFIMVDHTCEVADGIQVMAHIPQTHPVPKGNFSQAALIVVWRTSWRHAPGLSALSWEASTCWMVMSQETNCWVLPRG